MTNRMIITTLLCFEETYNFVTINIKTISFLLLAEDLIDENKTH
jgi:hypothetical protein